MRRFLIRFVPTLAVALLVVPLWAQQPGRGRGTGAAPGAMELLTNKSVIEELKLSDEQSEKVKKAASELRDKNKEALSEARKDKAFEKIQTINKEMNTAFAKTVEGTLKPEQIKRLHQIEIVVAAQRSGPAVFSMERVEKEIKLTDKQKDQLKEVAEELKKTREEAFKDIGRQDREKFAEAAKKFQTKTTESLDKFVAGLTSEQKKTWKDLTGEKFEYKVEQRRPKQ